MVEGSVDYHPGPWSSGQGFCWQPLVSDSDSEDGSIVQGNNRAQLPAGIENIRPHLDKMDNVPLLVSLFTDCNSDTTAGNTTITKD